MVRQLLFQVESETNTLGYTTCESIVQNRNVCNKHMFFMFDFVVVHKVCARVEGI